MFSLEFAVADVREEDVRCCCWWVDGWTVESSSAKTKSWDRPSILRSSVLLSSCFELKRNFQDPQVTWWVSIYPEEYCWKKNNPKTKKNYLPLCANIETRDARRHIVFFFAAIAPTACPVHWNASKISIRSISRRQREGSELAEAASKPNRKWIVKATFLFFTELESCDPDWYRFRSAR